MHDPDPEGRVSAKWEPVFPRDKRIAFARRSCTKQTERSLTENGPFTGAIFSHAWRPPFAPVMVSRAWNQSRRDNLVGRYRMPGAPQASDVVTAPACPPALGPFLVPSLFGLARAAFQHRQKYRSYRCFIGTRIAIPRLPPSC
jgi:hypothetical protein